MARGAFYAGHDRLAVDGVAGGVRNHAAYAGRGAAASELGSSSLGALSVRCSEGLGALDGAVVLELESFWLTPTPESIRREGKHNGSPAHECGCISWTNVLTLIF